MTSFCSLSQAAAALTQIQTTEVWWRKSSYATPSSEWGRITRSLILRVRKEWKEWRDKAEVKAIAFICASGRWWRRPRSSAPAAVRRLNWKELWSFTRIWVSLPRWPRGLCKRKTGNRAGWRQRSLADEEGQVKEQKAISRQVRLNRLRWLNRIAMYYQSVWSMNYSVFCCYFQLDWYIFCLYFLWKHYISSKYFTFPLFLGKSVVNLQFYIIQWVKFCRLLSQQPAVHSISKVKSRFLHIWGDLEQNKRVT